MLYFYPAEILKSANVTGVSNPVELASTGILGIALCYHGVTIGCQAFLGLSAEQALGWGIFSMAVTTAGMLVTNQLQMFHQAPIGATVVLELWYASLLI